MKSRKEILIDLSIAYSLLGLFSERTGAYKAECAVLADIVNTEVKTIKNTYIANIDKYRRLVARDRVFDLNNPQEAVAIIVDCLASALVTWGEIDSDKYKGYVNQLNAITQKLLRYRGDVNEVDMESGFRIMDEVREKMGGQTCYGLF